jgi:hypothetical protein
LLILSLENYYTTKTQLKIYEGFNIYFTLVYTIELWIKLNGIGLKNYFLSGERSNIYDAVIVLLSIIDIVVS